MLARLDRTTRSEMIAGESKGDLYRYREGPKARAVGWSGRLGRHKFCRGILLNPVSVSI